MIAEGSAAPVIVACVFVLFMWTKEVAKQRKAAQMQKHEHIGVVKGTRYVDVAVEITSDIKVAVDTLCQYGFTVEEARQKVNRAVERKPGSDYKSLINMAIKDE